MDLILNPVEPCTVGQFNQTRGGRENVRKRKKRERRERVGGNFHNRSSLYRTSKLSELLLDYGSPIKGRREGNRSSLLLPLALPHPWNSDLRRLVFTSRRPWKKIHVEKRVDWQNPANDLAILAYDKVHGILCSACSAVNFHCAWN